MIKRVFAIILTVLLLAPAAAHAETGGENEGTTLSCVALGDSIAAHYGLPAERGFVSVLSGLLTGKGYDNAFVNLAVSGSKTGDLLEALENPEMCESVRDADIIVISIGGNNILLPAQEYLTGSSRLRTLNEEELAAVIKKVARAMIIGKLPGDASDAMRSGIDGVSEDIPQIMKKLRELAPSAKIFVYTIYNPFPENFFLHKEAEELIIEANSIIWRLSEDCGYTVIDTYSLFNNAERETVNFSILSGFDIHPNAYGHELIARASAEEIERSLASGE